VEEQVPVDPAPAPAVKKLVAVQVSAPEAVASLQVAVLAAQQTPASPATPEGTEAPSVHPPATTHVPVAVELR